MLSKSSINFNQYPKSTSFLCTFFKKCCALLHILYLYIYFLHFVECQHGQASLLQYHCCICAHPFPTTNPVCALMPACTQNYIPTAFSSYLSIFTKEDRNKQSTKSPLQRRAQIPHSVRIIWYLEMGAPKWRPEAYFLEVKCSWVLFLQKEICNWNQNSSWKPICFREFNLKGQINHNLDSESGQDRIIFPFP